MQAPKQVTPERHEERSRSDPTGSSSICISPSTSLSPSVRSGRMARLGEFFGWKVGENDGKTQKGLTANHQSMDIELDKIQIDINRWNVVLRCFKRNYQARMGLGSKYPWCFDVFWIKKETLVAGFTYPKKTGAHYIIYIQYVYIYIETNQIWILYRYNIYTYSICYSVCTSNRQRSGTRKHARDG